MSMQRIIGVITTVILLFSLCGKAAAQEQEIEQLLLNVEKLSQLKSILSDMKQGYQIVSTGYNTIKDLSQGNFSLHKTFLDGLLEVSPTVRSYKKIAMIVGFQIRLVKEYKQAFGKFTGYNVFNTKELDYMGSVYSNLVDGSLQNLDDLTNVVTAGKLRMSDDERIEQIDRIYNSMADKLTFLRSFNNSTSVLALQRAKRQNDVSTTQSFYGIKK